MNWLYAAGVFFAGVIAGLMVGAMGSASRRADDEAEAAVLRLDDQKRAWHAGYLAGWDDKTEGRSMRSIIENPPFLVTEDIL